MMILAGISVTLLGFIVTVGSLAITSSNGARLAIVLFGIALSLFGILGMINPAYIKNAIWRKM